MRTFFALLLGLFLIVGCHKATVPPHLDDQATITMTSPDDESSFPLAASIDISAKINGNLTDYSFMKFAVLNASTRDTLTSGLVSKNGEIHVSWPNKFAAGTYYLEVVAMNPGSPDESISTPNDRKIYICIQPAAQINSLTKDNSSITIQWDKAKAGNFKAYELLVTRTDTAHDRGPYTSGKTLIRITDINQTSYRDTAIYIYYKYQYQVKVISQDDCENASDQKSIEAGTSIYLPGGNGKHLFDRGRNKFYYQPSAQDSSQNLYVIDPESLQVVNRIALPASAKLLNMDETHNALNFVQSISGVQYQLIKLNLATFSLSALDQFTLPASSLVQSITNGLVVYTNYTGGKILAIHNLSSNTDSTLVAGNAFPDCSIINTATLIATQYPAQTFYAFDLSGPTPQLLANKTLSSTAPAIPVFYSASSVAIGNTLFDASFNETGSLSSSSYFIGLSSDGSYAVDNSNNVLIGSNLSFVKKYGDGFTGTVYFSTDNKTMYHLTYGALSISWNPAPRLFKYVW